MLVDGCLRLMGAAIVNGGTAARVSRRNATATNYEIGGGRLNRSQSWGCG
jgi:hypothetical protein